MRPPDYESRGTALSMADSDDSRGRVVERSRPPPSCIHAVTVMLFLLMSIMTIFGRLAPDRHQLEVGATPSRLHQVLCTRVAETSYSKPKPCRAC